MQYSIAANWDPKLPGLLEGRDVTTLYGQIWADPLGGGRMLLFLPRSNRKDVESFIAEARNRGIEFNYLLNASCLDNLEFTKNGYKEMMRHLEWIADSGAETVTVTLPFLLEMIKRDFPGLKVCVSSFARVQNVQMAGYWEDLGADRIILPEIIARDFQALSLIRESVACELELIANHCCLYFCPLDLYHRNVVSHASQAGHNCGGVVADYCKLACQHLKLQRPVELIKSRWIRPEDVGVYEEIGIDCLKLVERFRDTRSLLQILDAYEQRSFPGNLAELLTLPKEGAYMAPNLELLDRPDLMDGESIQEILSVLREPFAPHLYIDNSRLEGFLDHYRKTDCLRKDCKHCGYCDEVAGRVIAVSASWREEMLEKFEKAKTALLSGKVSGYLRGVVEQIRPPGIQG